jgi:hypothetical protein
VASLDIVPVTTKAELDRFIRVPMRLNAEDPNYIAPLVMERQEALSAKVNPFFAHADVQFWLAVRAGIDVGRISAQIDHLAPQDPTRPTGSFGLIAAENDSEVFKALFATAEAWLKAKGMAAIQGPFNLSVNEEIGLLVDGFDSPPMVMMGHDPAYTAVQVEAQGYAKVKDVYAYLVSFAPDNPIDRLFKRVSRNPSPGVVLRKLDMSRYAEEVATLTEILNDAWRDNWGFTPTTEAETKHLATSMRPIIDPDLIWFAEIDGQSAGVCLMLPNLNEAIAGLGGKLLPFGWAKLLWRLKVRGVKSGRVPLMGVKKAFASSPRAKLLPFQMMGAGTVEARRKGYEWCEFSWILEDNMPMRKISEITGGERYKTYRIYEKALV